jgi:hypothetical protein
MSVISRTSCFVANHMRALRKPDSLARDMIEIWIKIKRGLALRRPDIGLKELVRAGLCHLGEIVRHRLQFLMFARCEDRCEFALVDPVLIDLLMVEARSG